jgi:hypothetical protein
MNFKIMLLLTGISVAVFMVLVTISLPLQTANSQSTNAAIAARVTSRVTTVDNKHRNKGIETPKIILSQIK